MKILFHCEQLNYRGTTNSVCDYALYNQEVLGNESVIVYSSKSPEGLDTGSVPSVVNKFASKFKLLQYDSNDHLNDIASNYDFCYSQRAGTIVDMGGITLPVITSTKFGVHCVFQYYNPHGDVYAYISEWLAKKVSITYNAPLHPFVPYIVDLPKPTYNIREAIGIPKNKLVFGRHGGNNTFDIPFVKQVIARIVSERDDIVFLFMNTEKFMDHPNVIFINPIFDRNMISNFVSACDAMLHGRNLGESFGLAIAEFLYHNKPVLAWEGGFDRNHVNWLSNYDLLYKDEFDLYAKIVNFRERDKTVDYSKIVEQFTPANVMRVFHDVFLSSNR
jgi:glycosyltransferase involved in cell wall biosynthesis